MNENIIIKEWSVDKNLPDISKEEFFPCLLWAYGPVPTKARKKLIAMLINSGCKSFICGGYDYKLWENDADNVLVNMSLENPSSNTFATTMTFKGDLHVDAVFDLLNITQVNDYVYKNYLVILVNPKIGDRGKMEQVIQEYDYKDRNHLWR